MAFSLVSIVGARPQFIKVAPMLSAVARQSRGDLRIEHTLVHTGQHYDPGMSDIFFEELGIPPAAFNLGVGSGSHGSQTGRMLEKIEEVLAQVRPNMVVTYGDTNSTVAGALAATKLHIPTGHVEAGLRSFNRRMPEEINRVAADHISDLLLAPTPTAVANLEKEGLTARTVLTGDLMYDAVLLFRERAEERSTILGRLGLAPGSYAAATIHRAENTEDEMRLRHILQGLDEVAERYGRVVFPVHPRTQKLLRSRFPGWTPRAGLELVPPIGYLDTLALVGHARVLLTDSGGLQKEAFFLGCPTVTLRDETEWVETVQWGGNVLAGTDPAAIRIAVSTFADRYPTGHADFSAGLTAAFGDGHAADRITDALVTYQPCA
jgi:UDP-N-acetylglucosamine 2-epimerase